MLKEVVVVVKVLWGDPCEKLCQAINEMPMSCSVIGSRGLGKLKRVLLGSVRASSLRDTPNLTLNIII
ncbi:hypothetical protein GUJ93_ZPchr0005g15204 [Zizania palustris]|uniref:UspA domain-containing protein n=1 Tax=Zizania palustris TaxID=103762 RepID=A0A8J5SKH3_ZIZPA|nr:hypothetical protein GUJ93_ZPchr0005g15204 [Zizania palustris]